MRKHSVLAVVTVLAAGLCLTAYAQKKAAGGKPPSGVASCRLSFSSYNPADSSIDVTLGGVEGSNAETWYVNEDNGLRCEMDTNTNRFFFDLNFFKYSGVRRQAWINLNFPVSGNPDDELGIPSTSDFFLTFGNLWNMDIGSEIDTGGQIIVPINGTYYSLYLGPGEGTGIKARRTSDSQWVVYAPPGSYGQLKFLGKGSKWVPFDPPRYYYFAFTITIDLVQ